jgi:hypothetical protein
MSVLDIASLHYDIKADILYGVANHDSLFSHPLEAAVPTLCEFQHCSNI